MLVLSDHPTVRASQRVIGFQEADAHEFLYQRVPLASAALLVLGGEWLLEQGEGPALGERKGVVSVLDVAGDRRTQGFQLPFGEGFLDRDVTGHPPDVA